MITKIYFDGFYHYLYSMEFENRKKNRLMFCVKEIPLYIEFWGSVKKVVYH